MPLATRSPSLPPGIQTTPKTYADYLKQYMEQYGIKSQPYNVAAPQVAPESPMGVNPGQILQGVAKGALANEAIGAGAGAAPATQFADILSMGQTMPAIPGESIISASGIGPTVANAAALPTAAPVAESALTSVGLPAAAVVAAALAGRSGFNMLTGKQKNWKDAGLVDNIGRVALAGGTFGLSEVANKLFGGGKLMSGKSKDQAGRDSIRSLLQGSGIADKSYMVNGFDIGKDGGARLQNVGTNINGKTDRGYYDVDFSNPLASKSIEGLRGIASATLGDKASEKQSNDLIGMLSNAALSNAKDEAGLNANLANIYKAAGLTFGGAPTATAAPRVVIPRSSTVSPGIRKDGSRIDYSKKRK